MALVFFRSELWDGKSFDYYLCEFAGDELPLHSHETYEHITVALAGEIECFTDDGASAKRRPGEPSVVYRKGRVHGIRGLTDGAMFVNIGPAIRPVE